MRSEGFGSAVRVLSGFGKLVVGLEEGRRFEAAPVVVPEPLGAPARSLDVVGEERPEVAALVEPHFLPGEDLLLVRDEVGVVELRTRVQGQLAQSLSLTQSEVWPALGSESARRRRGKWWRWSSETWRASEWGPSSRWTLELPAVWWASSRGTWP